MERHRGGKIKNGEETELKLEMEKQRVGGQEGEEEKRGHI